MTTAAPRMRTIGGRHPRAPVQAMILTALGVLAALLVGELGLRFFVRGWHYPETPIREVRGYGEGIAICHYEADGIGTYGRRLTGNPTLPHGTNGVILGDSHTMQDGVTDQYTMAAAVERIARSAGEALNVRQYGWYGGSAPAYIANAAEILQKWNPEWVAVTLNWTDFGAEPLQTSLDWRMEIRPDMSIRLIDVRPPEPRGMQAKLRQLLFRSSLAISLWRRSMHILDAMKERGPNTASAAKYVLDPERIIRASVRGLKQAYGQRLVIVYLATTSVENHEVPEPLERQILSICREEQVDCDSTGPADRRSLREEHQPSHGFHNTAPGFGHLNEAGSYLAGKTIWQLALAHRKGEH